MFASTLLKIGEQSQGDIPMIGGIRLGLAALAARQRPMEFLETVMDGTYRLRFTLGAKTVFVTADPDDVQHVLQKQHWNYTKSRSYEGLRASLGNGLVTSEGDFWRRQRKLAQPAFHKKRIEDFARDITSLTDATLQGWREQSSVDIHEEMMHLTMRIIAKTMFSKDIAGDAKKLGNAVTAMTAGASRVAAGLFSIPSWMPTPKRLAGKRAVAYLDDLIYGLIDERRKSGEDKGDLLGMYMSALGDHADEKMSDQQIRDEMLTIFTAGHETTAVALSWMFYLLSQRPTIVSRIRAELDDVVGQAELNYKNVAKLTYTEAVIKESMRFYPPVWGIERQAVSADYLGGHAIDRNTTIAIPLYKLHRHPDYWHEPEVFNPERFLPENAESIHKWAYLPFGGGPRICIGAGFAMLEAKMVTAAVLRQFDMKNETAVTPRIKAGITIRPTDPIVMRPIRRAS